MRSEIITTDSKDRRFLYIPTKRVARIKRKHIQLIEHMAILVQRYEAAGLAANQIGEDASILVYIDLESKQMRSMINPVITWQSKEEVPSVEACLSVPSQNYIVDRPSMIRVCHDLGSGKTEEVALEGMTARIILHEESHLGGMLISDMGQAVSIEENVSAL